MKFKLKKLTHFNEIVENAEIEIPTSDLTFANDQIIAQFDRVDEESEETKVVVSPGIYRIGFEGNSLKFISTDLRKQKMLDSVMNTQKITEEADRFFKKLHIYDMLEEPKARKILLYSSPGCGKSSSISKYAMDMREADDKSAIVIWPTSQVDSDDVLNLLTDCEYNDVSRLLLVMEDIGGGEREGSYAARGVDSGLLDLLDGVRNVYKVPTFVIATTNYPENLLSALADRPGRFDLMLKLEYPSAAERVALAGFFAKRALTPAEMEVFMSSTTNEFSVAHIKEAIVRHYLSDKPISETVKELIDHKTKYENSFEDKAESGKHEGRSGFGL